MVAMELESTKIKMTAVELCMGTLYFYFFKSLSHLLFHLLLKYTLDHDFDNLK